jgi:hypothetical protein
VNLPEWLGTYVADLGRGRLAGDFGRQAAVTALTAKITEKDDRPLIDGVLAEFAGRVLDAWHRSHQHPAAAGSPAQVQAELFPDLPPRLHIRPGVTKAPIEFTGHNWDTAWEMIRARTDNTIKGAEADRDQFEDAYYRVRPLLSGDLTTADVAALVAVPSQVAAP